MADPDLSLTQKQLRAAQGGDGEALDDLFARYLPRVRAMVASSMGRSLRQMVDVEDLVQDTFRDAVRGLDELRTDSEGLFVHWLSRTVENNVRDQLRRGSALRRGAGQVRAFADLGQSTLSESLFAGREHAASQVARGREAEERVERAMLRLGERYRRVISLRVHGELSYQEIAEVMGLTSENTANVLFLRARRRLGELIEPA